MPTFLLDLKIGQKARIVGIGNASKLHRRLLEMGLTSGAIIQIKAIAPFGDPISVAIRGSLLSLRKSEASQIIVELL